MTTHGTNEEQLLAFIEGELSAEEAAHLRASIQQSDPDLARRLDAMAGDRAALRDLPAVDPPVDFLAEIEPMIARPMLMDTQRAQPGAARRAHHRRQRRVQALQFAAAAVLVIGLSIGVLFTMNTMNLFSGSSGTTVADAQPNTNESPRVPGGGSNVDAAEDVEPVLTADGQLHHKLPALSTITAAPSSRRATADASSTSSVSSAPPKLDSPQLVHVDFALVLSASDRDAAEASLTAALQPDADRAALVRNLSVDELRRVEQRWRARRAAAGNPVREPAVADLDDSNRAQPQRSRLRLPSSLLNDNADELVQARLIAGRKELMPPYSRQVELSRSGAAYTIAIPLRELQPMLERLSDADIASAALRTITVETVGSESDAADATESASWPKQLARIRATIAGLERSNPDAVLLLPVVVESASE